MISDFFRDALTCIRQTKGVSKAFFVLEKLRNIEMDPLKSLTGFTHISMILAVKQCSCVIWNRCFGTGNSSI